MNHTQSAAIVPQDNAGGALAPFSVQSLMAQVKLIQEVMSLVMKENHHYGKVPGCGDKPTLLKPGAEKLAFVFRLNPEFEVRQEDLPGGNRTYTVICTMKQIGSGHTLGQGVGVCSTMEAKYRFRSGPRKGTGKPVPKEYWNVRNSDPKRAMELLGGKGFGTQKDASGNWEICEQGEKAENDNPADVYNTVLKMAKKRAQVDATLTCTAASDIFTQDLEDIAENMKAHKIIESATVVDSVSNGSHPSTTPAPQAAQTAAPAQTQAQTAPAAAGTQDGSWRGFIIPRFVKNIGGMDLGSAADGHRESAAWWGKNFVPKEYPAGSGRINPNDIAFRTALDAMMSELFQNGGDHTPPPATRRQNPVTPAGQESLDEDVPF